MDYPSKLYKAVENSLNRRLLRPIHDVTTFAKKTFLFIAGLYQESKRKISGPLSIRYSNLFEKTYLRQIFLETFEISPKEMHKRKNFLRFYSIQVEDVIDKLTDGNSRPPYELLETTERKIVYLRGFLFNGARVYSEQELLRRVHLIKEVPRLRVYSKNNLGLIRQIQTLLVGLGIETSDRFNGFAINKINELKKVLDLSLLSKSQAGNLESLLT